MGIINLVIKHGQGGGELSGEHFLGVVISPPPPTELIKQNINA